MSSPTQRTLKHLRDQGYTAQVVERWNPHARKRQDLFGVADVVALDDEQGVLAVQTTTASNASARCKKVQDSETIRLWLERGNRLIVHGWRQKGNKKGTPWLLNEWEAILNGEQVITKRMDNKGCIQEN